MKWVKPAFLVVALALALAFSSACKSKSIKLPQPDLNADPQKQWLEKYKTAKDLFRRGELDKACPLFTELAKDEKFPVRQVAELRQRMTCAEKNQAALHVSDYPRYLSDLAVEAGLAQAKRNVDLAAEMEFATQKSKRKLAQKEKVLWIRRAIEIATEIKSEEKIIELERRLYTAAPRLNLQPKPEEWLSVASDFRTNREFAKAREFYEKIIKSGNFSLEDKIAAHKGLRLAEKNSRNNDAHLASARRLVHFLRKNISENPKSQSARRAYYEAQVFYARALWTQGQNSEAEAIFSRLEKEMNGQISLAEVHWLRGRMAEEKKDFAEVNAQMQKALLEAKSDSELREKVMWDSAWNNLRRKEFASAIETLSELNEKTQSEFTRARALYWLGRAQAAAKFDDLAKTSFETLIDLDPLGYYGLLARRQMGMAISLERKAETKTATESSSPNLPLDAVLAEWLALLEESELLTLLLDEASLAYKKQADQSDEGWVKLFKFYARGGLYMKLYESLATLTPDRRRSVLESDPELLFPQPWNEDVRTAALQFGVAEELIYSIMRQESAFNTQARSVADAFGLMQILPEVAERLSRENRIKYSGMDDLYTPATNIHLGAAHLKELLARNKGQFILAVASYNANENAIRKWLHLRYRGDSEEFIEEIPYEETRAYVRLVMRNLIFYSLLKSQSASIEFPAWVLKMDPS